MKKFKVKNLRFKVGFVLLFIFFTFNISLLPVSPLGGSFNIASASTAISNTLKSNNSLSGTGSGLVGHWTLDGKDIVNNIADVSGRYATGSLILGSSGSTATTTASGRLGQALSFDGVDDQVAVQSTLGLGNSNLSIFTWVYLYSTSESGAFVKIGKNTTGNAGYGIGVGSNDFDTNGNELLILFEHVRWIDPNINIGMGWHHVGTVLDSSGTPYFYLDGRFVASSAGSSAQAPSPATGNTQIGGYTSVTPSNRYGKYVLDDVRIYNRALSAGEVKRLYQLGATSRINVSLLSNKSLNKYTVSVPSMVGHFTFDGKDMNTQLIDSSGYGINGDYNFTPASATTSALVIGRMGQALSFDGTDDYVSLPAYNLTGSSSIAFWLKVRSYDTGGTFSHVIMTDDPGVQWEIALENDGGFTKQLDAVMYTSGSPTFSRFRTDVNGVTTNVWEHWTIVFDNGPHRVTIYKNGASTTVSAMSDGGGSPAGSGGAYDIMRRGAGNNDSYCDCVIDDLRIYNKALTVADAKRLYDLGATTKINKTVRANDSLKSGLVGHWTFDGPNMNPAVMDSSGQGNNGRLTLGSSGSTATTTIAGVIGQGIKLDGVDDVIRPSTGLGTSAGTISFWQRGKSGSTYWGTYSQTRNASPTVNGLMIGVNSSGNSSFYIHQTGGWTNANAGTIDTTKWHHIVGTYTDGQNMKIYVDGQAYTGNAYVAANSNIGSDNLYIGYEREVNSYLDGSLDDVRVYNRALSAGEIKRLYDLGR